MSLSKALYPLLSIGSTQEDRKSSQHNLKIVDWKHKQNEKGLREVKLVTITGI